MPYTKSLIKDWKGVDQSAPGLFLDPSTFKELDNWIINKGRLYPFPKLGTLTSLPKSSTDSSQGYLPVLGAGSFMDVYANWHTILLNQRQPYYLNSDGTYTALFDTSGNVFIPNNAAPYAVEVYQNQIYFANGGAPVSYVKGDGYFRTAGDVPGTCFFLGKLAAHLLMIDTIEPANSTLGAIHYPSRVRWSASGDATEWLVGTDETAGATDLSDVEDELTGWATISNVGFAFRKHGISSFTPTGVALKPFTIENFSIGSKGVGCFIPYTVAVYGRICVFVAEDDIYSFTGYAPMPIGTTAKKVIFADIASATDQITAFMLGQLMAGVDFLTYWLCIPQTNGITNVWIYHFASQSWTRIQLPFGAMKCLASLVVA